MTVELCLGLRLEDLNCSREWIAKVAAAFSLPTVGPLTSGIGIGISNRFVGHTG